MDHKILMKILDVSEIAATDEEYLRLYADYAPAQKKGKGLLAQLPQNQRKSLEDYLYASVELYRRLMALAIQYDH